MINDRRSTGGSFRVTCVVSERKTTKKELEDNYKKTWIWEPAVQGNVIQHTVTSSWHLLHFVSATCTVLQCFVVFLLFWLVCTMFCHDVCLDASHLWTYDNMTALPQQPARQDAARRRQVARSLLQRSKPLVDATTKSGEAQPFISLTTGHEGPGWLVMSSKLEGVDEWCWHLTFAK